MPLLRVKHSQRVHIHELGTSATLVWSGRNAAQLGAQYGPCKNIQPLSGDMHDPRFRKGTVRARRINASGAFARCDVPTARAHTHVSSQHIGNVVGMCVRGAWCVVCVRVRVRVFECYLPTNPGDRGPTEVRRSFCPRGRIAGGCLPPS